jgi:hypothetical protein
MIKMSVCIPMFRAKYIGWLPFESLIRQENVEFEWELIIAEEMHDEAMGREKMVRYKEKLETLGCVRFKYIGLEKWIPLTNKLQLLLENCNEETDIFVWHSADYFSAPKRLITHYNNFHEHNYHFSVPYKAIYYNIANGHIALHNSNHPKWRGRRFNDVIGKAWSYSLIKEYQATGRRAGVDGHLFRSCKKLAGGPKKFRIYREDSDNWKYALSTHSLNNITSSRAGWMQRFTPPYYECPINIDKTIPPKIMKRLRACKKFVAKHKRGFPPE